MTLSKFLEVFQERCGESLSIKTMKSYLLSGRTFCEIVGDRDLGSYRLVDVDQFKAEYGKQVKPISVNIALRSLKAVFSRAVEWELTQGSPFTRAKLLRVPQSPPAFLNRVEQLRFLGIVEDPVLRSLFEFLFNTGLRIGEALSLRWDNVDLARRQVSVVNFGGFSTKTRTNRVVPLNDHAWAALPARGKSAFVFSRKGKPLTPDYASHEFKFYVRHGGFPEELHLHSTRHSFASNLVTMNVSLFMVGNLLGHSNPSQTTRLYAHLATSELHNVVALL
jgi:integrase/recombinase XerD